WSTMIARKTLKITNSDRSIEFPPAADALTGCSADTSTDRWKGIWFSRYLQSFIVTPLCNKTDIQPGVCAHGTRCLTRCSQVFLLLTKPCPPALPGLTTFGYMPGLILAPECLPWHLWRCACIGIEWLPPLLWWKR